MKERQVTHIRLSVGGQHQAHISHFRFVEQNGDAYSCTRDQMVAFVNSHTRGAAYTLLNGRHTPLYVVSHWVETVPDGTTLDNLLSLPHF